MGVPGIWCRKSGKVELIDEDCCSYYLRISIYGSPVLVVVGVGVVVVRVVVVGGLDRHT